MSAQKEYTNGEITVVWQSGKCIHSENCVNGLPEVFKPKEKPWIQVDDTSSGVIEKAVSRCPSGALTTYWNNNPKTTQPESTMEKTHVEVLKDGPLMVKGALTIKKANGEEEIKTQNTFFCRCGASSNKPYCDGSHKKVGFTG